MQSGLSAQYCCLEVSSYAEPTSESVVWVQPLVVCSVLLLAIMLCWLVDLLRLVSLQQTCNVCLKGRNVKAPASPLKGGR